MNTTVLGATGFIGSHLAEELRRRGRSVFTPDRNASLVGTDLGVVYYCIGLTADFRSRPFDTIAAHVCRLRDILEGCRFTLLVYLSSTRIYASSPDAIEELPLLLDPASPSDLYNLSKATGESLALHSGRPVRIIRLSNVYGADWTSGNFLQGLVRDAVVAGEVSLRSSPLSAKDYVSVEDVVDLLIRIGTHSDRRIYNVASGRNVMSGELLARLREICGCTIRADPADPALVFPPISIARVREEFGFSPRCVLHDLPGLVAQFREHAGAIR